MGFCRRYLITRGGETLATYGDRFVFSPPGIFGGHPGARAESHVVRNGRKIRIGSKQSFALEKGDMLVMLTGGGAGYGDPAERPPHLVEQDVTQGFVSPAAARRLYRRAAARRSRPRIGG